MAGRKGRRSGAPRVLVVGSANVDIVVPVRKLPASGETVLGGERKEFWGGKGANQAVAAQKAGAEVRLVSALGSDGFGAAYRKYLADVGIGRRGLISVPGPTGAALIVVDEKGRNQIAVSPGANSFLTPGLLEDKRKKDVMEYGEVVLAQLEVPREMVSAAFRSAKRRGAVTVLNPAPAPKTIHSGLMSLVDFLFPNETEAAALCGMRRRVRKTSGLVRLCRNLREKGAKAVVLTAGEKGALVFGEAESGWVKPPPGIRPVDTTGAGDAFCGALAARLARKAPLADAVRFAVAAASLSVQKRGAQPGIHGRRAIQQAMRRTRFERKFAC